MKSYKKVCKTLEDTKQLAYKFAELIKDGCFINLYGEIGAGKTAFVKLVADALDVVVEVVELAADARIERRVGGHARERAPACCLFDLGEISSVEKELQNRPP